MNARVEEALAWWRGLSGRERWMLAGLAAVLVALAAWFGVWAPLNGWARSAAERYGRAAVAVSEAEAMAGEIARSEQMRGGRAGPLAEAIGRSAAAAGVPVSRIEPVPDGGLAVWTEAAPPKALFAWLAAVRGELGVDVRALEAEKADEGVQARIVFEGAGR